MAVTGTLSKSRQWRWVMYMVICAGFAIWCLRDGWFNPAYRVSGKEGDLLFSRSGAIALGAGFVILLVGLFVIRRTKVVMDDNGIDVNGKFMIPWSAMIRVDDSRVEKAYLDIYYQDAGREAKYVLDGFKVSHFDDMLDEISVHRPDLLPPAQEASGGTEVK
jgi:hypothetical protein